MQCSHVQGCIDYFNWHKFHMIHIPICWGVLSILAPKWWLRMEVTISSMTFQQVLHTTNRVLTEHGAFEERHRQSRQGCRSCPWVQSPGTPGRSVQCMCGFYLGQLNKIKSTAYSKWSLHLYYDVWASAFGGFVSFKGMKFTNAIAQMCPHHLFYKLHLSKSFCGSTQCNNDLNSNLGPNAMHPSAPQIRVWQSMHMYPLYRFWFNFTLS